MLGPACWEKHVGLVREEEETCPGQEGSSPDPGATGAHDIQQTRPQLWVFR